MRRSPLILSAGRKSCAAIWKRATAKETEKERRKEPWKKLIISAAICGAEVTKEQNPAVPYTVEEIAREAKVRTMRALP